jgi:DNA repair protein RecO (recombination protein O)
MPDFTTNAILLKKVEFGDHDLIISFFTQSRGKISVIAKNAKKSIKRFSGPFDIFCMHHIQCSFPKKKKDGLIILAKADLEKGFVNIRHDVLKTAYASFWLEMLYFYLEENKKEADLYDLLLFSLQALNKESIAKEILSLLFQIRFMNLSGFSPNLEHCGRCKTSIDNIEQQNLRFDFKGGEIVCQNCLGKGPHHGMTISKGTVKQLFWIKNSDIKKAKRIKFSPYAIKEGAVLLESFISFHIGKEFKSIQFLKTIRPK